MRLRLKVVSILSVFVVVVLGTLRLTGTVQGPEQAAGEERWQRENSYVVAELTQRTRYDEDTPGRQDHVPVPAASGPNRIRVLVVGDSSTEGHGLYDLDQRWPVKLQRLLDAQIAPGVFDVRTLALSGASTILETQWLASGILDEYDPDVVVLAYNVNDVVPSGREDALCPKEQQPCQGLVVEMTPQWEECLRQAAPGGVPLSDDAKYRLCDPIALSKRMGIPSYQQLVQEPERTVYWTAFRDAVDQLRGLTSGRVALLVNVTGDSGVAQKNNASLRELAKAMTMIPAEETRRAISAQGGDPELRANPVDEHPGPAATAAIASDVAAGILAHVPAERVQQALRGAKPVTRMLVSNYLPSTMDVQVRGLVGATARYPGQESERLEDYLLADAKAAGLAPQRAPCALIGAPHAQLWIDRDYPPGTLLDVTLTSAEQPMEILTAGYRDDRATWQSLGVLSPGEQVRVRFDPPQAKGILVAVPRSPGCDPAVPVTLPAFQVDISRVD